MNPWLIVYATREGQTRRIVERLAAHIESRHVPAVIIDLSTFIGTTPLELDDYGAVILAASVHNRRHEPEAVAFARRHAPALNRLPCCVLSVSSAQMIAESSRASRLLRSLAATGADKLLEAFLAETGLQPTQAIAVAGALAYTKYSPLQRLLFRCVALLAGLPTDTSHDQSTTNFAELEKRIDVLLRQGYAARAPRPDGSSARVREP